MPKVKIMNSVTEIEFLKLQLKWTKVFNSSCVLFDLIEVNTEHGYTNFHLYDRGKDLKIVFQLCDNNELYLVHDSWVAMHEKCAIDHPVMRLADYLSFQDVKCHKFNGLKHALEFVRMFMEILAV